MKFDIRPELKIALILFLVLAVYFQTIYHPFSPFDDAAIVEYYGINSIVSFSDVIAPGKSFYYRPLVDLSFWLDNQWWGMDSTFMHLENIVAHLVNVLLVFFIASRLPLISETKVLPYISALIFGVHPINSESVNWIAGRTDVYAGVFVFLAVYCLIRSIEEQSVRFALLAFGVAFIGTLAKETAIMFIPVSFLTVLFWPVVNVDETTCKIWRKRFLLAPIAVLACLSLLAMIFLYMKGNGNNAVASIVAGESYKFIRALEAFGFYIKKFFLPLPLNAAIVDVNPLYAMLGIIAPCAIFFSVKRAGVTWVFLVSAALFILPAIFVAVTPIAWTPFGERYLYIPSAFAVIGCVEYAYRIAIRWNAVKLLVPVVVMIIVISSFATFKRATLWENNFALVEDIIAKSPGFGVARNVYAGMLGQAGRYAEAEEQLRIVLQQDNSESVKNRIKLNLVSSKINGKPLDEAKKILLSEITGKSAASVELLMQLNRIELGLLGRAESIKDRRSKAVDIAETNENLFLKTGDPFHLYRSGQVMLSVEDKRAAADYFRRAYNDNRLKEYYREPARILVERLEAK